MSDRNEDAQTRKVSGAFVRMFLFSLYLRITGVDALTTGRWPLFLTLLIFDALHGIFSMFRARAATYLMGGLVCTAG